MKKWIGAISAALALIVVSYFWLEGEKDQSFINNNQALFEETVSFLSLHKNEIKSEGNFSSEPQIDEQEEGGWKLVFFDDFKGEKLNTKKWTAQKRKENYNNELQEYSPKNVEIRDGRLQLIAKDDGVAPKKYSSGLVETKGKFDFLYGKVEVKGRYPVGKGLFPAIWMLPSDGKDYLPEIDIFENVGHEPHLVYQVHHWREHGKLKTTYNKTENQNIEIDHIYGIEWEENEIRWYVNEELVFTSTTNIPDIPMHLIINLAIGGNWPGDPDSNTFFPAMFSIDYVKIYKKVGK
ncbi:MAG: glycoside hydrolase family 16 protein [Bacillaceae bacterium]|nr:glycoside hydrolase family 16 protein [Bacillaceae bacterium]